MDLSYNLKFLLNSKTLQVTGLKDMSDESQRQIFYKKYSSVRIIKGFVTALPSSKSATVEIPVHGVSINDGMSEHKAYYVEAAIGKSLFATRDYAYSCHPPSVYDSFLVSTDQMDVERVIDVTKEADIQKFSYVVRDPSKVLVICEVKFLYDRKLEENNRGTSMCDACQSQPATMYCVAERASFCEACEKRMHFNDFLQRHKRYYYSQVGKKKFISCAFHPDMFVEFYCEKCAIPLCSSCKITGNHSQPPYSAHKVIEYLRACDMLRHKLEEEKTAIYAREKEAQACLSRFKSDVSNFRAGVESVRIRIEAEYKRALADLGTIVKRKYQIANAAYIQRITALYAIKRMREHVDEIDSSSVVLDYKCIVEHQETLAVDADKFDVEPIELRGELKVSIEEYGNSDDGRRVPRVDIAPEMYVRNRNTK